MLIRKKIPCFAMVPQVCLMRNHKFLGAFFCLDYHFYGNQLKYQNGTFCLQVGNKQQDVINSKSARLFYKLSTKILLSHSIGFFSPP